MSISCFLIDMKFISKISNIFYRNLHHFSIAILTQVYTNGDVRFYNFRISNFHIFRNATFLFVDYAMCKVSISKVNFAISKFHLKTNQVFQIQMFTFPTSIFFKCHLSNFLFSKSQSEFQCFKEFGTYTFQCF